MNGINFLRLRSNAMHLITDDFSNSPQTRFQAAKDNLKNCIDFILHDTEDHLDEKVFARRTTLESTVTRVLKRQSRDSHANIEKNIQVVTKILDDYAIQNIEKAIDAYLSLTECIAESNEIGAWLHIQARQKLIEKQRSSILSGWRHGRKVGESIQTNIKEWQKIIDEYANNKLKEDPSITNVRLVELIDAQLRATCKNIPGIDTIKNHIRKIRPGGTKLNKSKV